MWSVANAYLRPVAHYSICYQQSNYRIVQYLQLLLLTLPRMKNWLGYLLCDWHHIVFLIPFTRHIFNSLIDNGSSDRNQLTWQLVLCYTFESTLMVSDHGANPIFLNKKITIGRPEQSLPPPPSSYNISCLLYPLHPSKLTSYVYDPLTK